MVEHAAVNRVVEGSSPSSGATLLPPNLNTNSGFLNTSRVASSFSGRGLVVEIQFRCDSGELRVHVFTFIK